MGKFNLKSIGGEATDDVELGGSTEARMVQAEIESFEEKVSQAGNDTLNVKFNYGGRVIYGTFTNSEGAARQLLINFLTVAGVEDADELPGKKVTLVLQPEEYVDKQGNTKIGSRIWTNGVFTHNGWSAGEVTRNMQEEPSRLCTTLEEAKAAGVAPLRSRGAAGSTKAEPVGKHSNTPF